MWLDKEEGASEGKKRKVAWQNTENQENSINNSININKVQLHLSCIEIKDMGAQQDQPE